MCRQFTPLTLNVTFKLCRLLPWQPSSQMVRHLLADDATSGPCGRNVSFYLTENNTHECSGALSVSRRPAVFIWTWTRHQTIKRKIILVSVSREPKTRQVWGSANVMCYIKCRPRGNTGGGTTLHGFFDLCGSKIVSHYVLTFINLITNIGCAKKT